MDFFTVMQPFLETYGFPSVVVIALLVVVFRSQKNASDSDTRSDVIVTKQLEISSTQAGILERQSAILSEVVSHAKANTDAISANTMKIVEVKAMLGTNAENTKKNMESIGLQLSQLSDMWNKLNTTVDKNTGDISSLSALLKIIRDDMILIQADVSETIKILNNSKENQVNGEHPTEQGTVKQANSDSLHVGTIGSSITSVNP